MDDTFYNWLFWNNGTDWYAIHRDSQLLFFCGRRSESTYLKNKHLEMLIVQIRIKEKLNEHKQK